MQGPSGVIQTGRGGTSNRRMREEERRGISSLLSNKCRGFNDVLAAEMLSYRTMQAGQQRPWAICGSQGWFNRRCAVSGFQPLVELVGFGYHVWALEHQF